jgi:hypothetical protein
MRLLRGSLAVIVGYLVMMATSKGIASGIFAEGAVPAEGRALILSFLGLALGAAIGGAICTLIAGSTNSPAIYIAIGGVALVSGRALIQGTGIEPDWYKMLSVIALAIGFLVGASAAAYKLDPR